MTVLETPVRSHEQRLEALREGNRIRSHRAQVKRDLKAGRLTLSDLFRDELCDTMKIADALVCLPRFGRTRVNQGLGNLRISSSTRIGRLTIRQKVLLEQAVQSGRPASEWIWK